MANKVTVVVAEQFYHTNPSFGLLDNTLDMCLIEGEATNTHMHYIVRIPKV